MIENREFIHACATSASSRCREVESICTNRPGSGATRHFGHGIGAVSEEAHIGTYDRIYRRIRFQRLDVHGRVFNRMILCGTCLLHCHRCIGVVIGRKLGLCRFYGKRLACIQRCAVGTLVFCNLLRRGCCTCGEIVSVGFHAKRKEQVYALIRNRLGDGYREPCGRCIGIRISVLGAGLGNFRVIGERVDLASICPVEGHFNSKNSTGEELACVRIQILQTDLCCERGGIAIRQNIIRGDGYVLPLCVQHQTAGTCPSRLRFVSFIRRAGAVRLSVPLDKGVACRTSERVRRVRRPRLIVCYRLCGGGVRQPGRRRIVAVICHLTSNRCSFPLSI